MSLQREEAINYLPICFKNDPVSNFIEKQFMKAKSFFHCYRAESNLDLCETSCPLDLLTTYPDPPWSVRLLRNGLKRKTKKWWVSFSSWVTMSKQFACASFSLACTHTHTLTHTLSHTHTFIHARTHSFSIMHANTPKHILSQFYNHTGKLSFSVIRISKCSLSLTVLESLFSLSLSLCSFFLFLSFSLHSLYFSAYPIIIFLSSPFLAL